MDDSILVSVVIPTYNREKTIQKSIDSVLNQTYRNIELVVIDDGSTDGTETLVKSIQDERLKYYKISCNKGAGAARNSGVSYTTGDYIAFHDSDDAWTKDKLEKQMEKLLAHPEWGLVYSAYAMHLPYDIRHIVPPMDGSLKLEGDIFPDLLIRNTIGAPTVLMKKSIFEEVEGFDESMRSLEDWDFALKVAKKYPIGFADEVLLEVESTAGGVSSNHAMYYKNRCYMLRKYKNDYIQTGLFQKATEDILLQAKNDGILEQVGQMIMAYL